MPGFPGGLMIKNLPAKVGDAEFNPWSGKIPHATGQLSPRAPTAESVLYSPSSTTREGTTVRSQFTTAREWPPLSSAREQPAQQQRPSTAKKKKKQKTNK